VARAERVLLLGAGPVGLELAGEIAAEWPEKRVVILDRAPEILPGQSREFQQEIRRQLEELRVTLRTGTALEREPETPPGIAGAFIATTRSGETVAADLWFRCHGSRPVTDYLAGSLASSRDEHGFLKVSPELLLAGQERVFAVGDIAAIAESKRAKAAMGHATVVAANVEAIVAGRRPTSTYAVPEPAIVLPLGPNHGASEAPALGIVGAEETSSWKGADLNVARFRALLGYGGELS
jgi:NADH dehydrogenase FAD-containing subunit